MIKKHDICRVASLEPLAKDTYALTLKVNGDMLKYFRPGQFAHIRLPHAGEHLLRRPISVNTCLLYTSGINEHPTQALLDMFTMKEKLGDLKGLEVAILGDIYHSRVARSNIFGLTTMGAHVTVCGPGTLLPGGIEKLGASATLDARAAVRNADVVMALRIQRERQKGGLFPSVREYHQFYGVDEELLSLARPHALVMHPGPVNRGVELTSSVDDGEQSVITEQVTNGVAVRMALLYLLTRRA